MHFVSKHLFHIYNQGNNRQPIFFSRENYLFFLKKVNTHLKPVCNIMSWCLMPNHFHFLIGTSDVTMEKVKVGGIEMTRLSDGFRVLESSYTRAINVQEKRTGSLFRQRTKSKCLTEEAFDFDDPAQLFAPDFLNIYPLVCFHYIHQNPAKACLVANPEDWEFSSSRDHLGLRNGKLCDFDLCRRWVGVKPVDLQIGQPVILDPAKVSRIFV